MTKVVVVAVICSLLVSVQAFSWLRNGEYLSNSWLPSELQRNKEQPSVIIKQDPPLPAPIIKPASDPPTSTTDSSTTTTDATATSPPTTTLAPTTMPTPITTTVPTPTPVLPKPAIQYHMGERMPGRPYLKVASQKKIQKGANMICFNT